MKWPLPPTIKILEALGAVADGRIEVTGDRAAVRSSSGGKAYDVVMDPATNAITANDNATYWKGYLGYPVIAFLLATGRVSYDAEIAQALVGIAWKDVNTRFKNDFAKTEAYVHELAAERGIPPERLDAEVARILAGMDALRLEKTGRATKPPEGY